MRAGTWLTAGAAELDNRFPQVACASSFSHATIQSLPQSPSQGLFNQNPNIRGLFGGHYAAVSCLTR